MLGDVLRGLGARGLSRRQELRPGGLDRQQEQGQNSRRARHGPRLGRTRHPTKLNRGERSAELRAGDPDHQGFAGSGGDRRHAMHAIGGKGDQHAAVTRRGFGPASGQELEVAALIL